MLAVFAHIAHHQPVDCLARSIGWQGMLDERDMPPRRRGKFSRIVVTVACKRIAIGGQLVPLLAGNFAGLAANADCSVGKKPF
jgi:hypothetical protein